MPQRKKTVVGFVAWRRKRKIEKWPQSQRGTAEHDSGDPPLADPTTFRQSAHLRLNLDAADQDAFDVGYAPDSGSKADIPFSPSRATTGLAALPTVALVPHEALLIKLTNDS
jgi:hypothetical protein